MINVPLLDLKAQFAQIREEVLPSSKGVRQPTVHSGRACARSRKRRSPSTAARRHGIGVSSGTDALLLALMALEVGAGDEVITTPFTFFATAGTIARVGARPVFCDIDPKTFNLSPAAVQTFIDAAARRTATA
jgi:dTDP-4-amino-4,6-dideoxygalactose transaminase